MPSLGQWTVRQALKKGGAQMLGTAGGAAVGTGMAALDGEISPEEIAGIAGSAVGGRLLGGAVAKPLQQRVMSSPKLKGAKMRIDSSKHGGVDSYLTPLGKEHEAVVLFNKSADDGYTIDMDLGLKGGPRVIEQSMAPNPFDFPDPGKREQRKVWDQTFSALEDHALKLKPKYYKFFGDDDKKHAFYERILRLKGPPKGYTGLMHREAGGHPDSNGTIWLWRNDAADAAREYFERRQVPLDELEQVGRKKRRV